MKVKDIPTFQDDSADAQNPDHRPEDHPSRQATLYRLLNEGEIIQEGDEQFHEEDFGKWGPVFSSVDLRVGENDYVKKRIYRRPLSPPETGNPPNEWVVIRARLDNYFGNGGFFNPEIMEHDEVRRLLIDLRDLIDNKAPVPQPSSSLDEQAWLDPFSEWAENKAGIHEAGYPDARDMARKAFEAGRDYERKAPTPRPDSTLAGLATLIEAAEWLLEFVVEPDDFPGDGDQGYWHERLAWAMQQIKLAKSAEGSEVPTPQTATDDVGKTKTSFSGSTLISALRKVAANHNYRTSFDCLMFLANELEERENV